MSKQTDAIAQVLAAQALNAPQSPQAIQQNPMLLNQPLEAAATPDRAPLHPIVAAIMQHLGLLNMIRNRGNQQVVDPEQLIQQ